MNTTTTAPVAVDEHVCASALGMSVAWLRKDRHGERLIPYFRLGRSVRYNLDRCREALDAIQVGGKKARQ